MAGKKICVGNFKGGVGKTLISYLLYKHFKNEYELIQSDLDVINNNIIHIATEEELDKKLDEIKEILKEKNLIVDTGGFLDDLQTRFFKRSHLIIVPLFLDTVNIKRTFLFLKYLQKNNIHLQNVLIVINKFKKEQEQTKKEFINYVKENYNITKFFTLNDYKSYVSVLNKDINLIEENNKNKVLYKSAVEQILELNNTIKKILGE